MAPNSTSRLILDTTGLPGETINTPITHYSTIDPLRVHFSNENTSPEVSVSRVLRRLWRNTQSASRKSLLRQVNWGMEGRTSYHDYVHQLVDAGWDNLKGLDDCMM